MIFLGLVIFVLVAVLLVPKKVLDGVARRADE
jgi:hypothetical protein